MAGQWERGLCSLLLEASHFFTPTVPVPCCFIFEPGLESRGEHPT